MTSNQHFHEHGARSSHADSGSFLTELWESFWDPPHIICPKCNSEAVEYYDPFFFSPIRAIKGRRRVKCTTCHFIWRPSRRKKSLFKGLWPFL